MVLDKAKTEAEIWRNLQTSAQDMVSSSVDQNLRPQLWSKPPGNWVKCNIASSWVSGASHSGGAWIVKDNAGSVLFHSRRSFCRSVTALLADLISLQWSVEAMVSLKIDKVMFETSSGVLKEAFSRGSSFPHVNQFISEILLGLETSSCGEGG